MLEKAKMALRITGSHFDAEIQDLIEAAYADLGLAGIKTADPEDPLIGRAVITYVKTHFGEADQYDRLKASYDEQKAQLMIASDYTNYGGDADGQIQDPDADCGNL